ncbi:MAG: hypothetical protein L0Y76_11550 [Ignavibacteria bacterium]|nr:hypothetical protein [Ignavibacteria bacterium]
MKIKVFVILFTFICGLNHAQTVRRIDFEAGGFVLAQVPSKDGSKVYARTDVGGVYKKTGDGNWEFIGEFATTPAALMVQSIDVNPHKDGEITVACGMDYLPDDPGRGVWKTTDDGITWKQVLGPETGNPEVNFGGNVFRIKLGGPCMRWHPSVTNRMLAGTLADPSTGKPYVYISEGDGEPGTWNLVNGNSGITGNVVCIQVHPSFPDEVWIGTDKGLWRTKDNGVTWSEQLFPSEISGVYQMLFKIDKNGNLMAFVTTGKLFRIENDCAVITDLSQNFGYYDGYGAELIGLQFINYSEDSFWAVRMGNSSRYTTNDGETWSERYEYVLEKEYNPKHTLFTQDKIYTSDIIGFQNPANKDIWYVSGGAGPFITTNNGKTWRFNGEGIDMTVVYDVTFSITGDIYIPISDWGMAKTNDALLPKISDFSRKYTLDPPPPENNGDSYIPNVCRVLISEINPDRIYLIGGSVFSYYPAIAKSENRGEPGTYQIMSPEGLLAYPKFGPGHDAIISDGEITTDGTNDHLILKIGGGQYKRKVYDESNPSAYWYGVYYSSDGGATFQKSVFEGYSDNIYRNSILGGLFSPTDYLDVDPVDKSRVYLYLEGGNENGVKAGGLFISTDYGKTFSFKNYVVENADIDYRNRGAIDINPDGSGILWAGIENYGLFKSSDRGENFSKIPGWKSVSTVDSRGNQIAIFGKKDEDSFNKIYLSKDGGESWEHVYLQGFGVIPSVRKLDLREHNGNELWISTGGQGVFIFSY